MISRRTVLGLFALALASPARAEPHPSVAFMERVGKELLNAHRQGTVSSFMRVVQRYADIPGISNHSIGTYEVPSSSLQKYRRGVATFISRYLAEQSRNYPVAKYVIGDATVDGDKNIFVTSQVYMMAGQTYTVTWKLAWQGGSYKIIDAKFLGFSMTNQERSLFTSYIQKHGGDVNALILALNR